MKSKNNLFIRFLILTVIVLLPAAVFSGCAYYVKPTPPPLTIADIIKLSKEHVLDIAIIKRLRASHEVFYFTARQVIKLHNDGISSGVLNYMLRTGIRKKQRRALRRGQRLQPYWVWQNWNWNWAPYAPYPYFYPY